MAVRRYTIARGQRLPQVVEDATAVTPGAAVDGVTVSFNFTPNMRKIHALDLLQRVLLHVKQMPWPARVAVATVPDLAVTVTGSLAEGGTMTATFTLSAAAAGTVTFDAAISGVGANPVNAADFGGTFPSWTGISIPAGSLTATRTFAATDDADVEPDETGRVTISNASGATIATATADFTVLNNDASGLSLSGTMPASIEQNEAWAGVTFAASGGTAPYTYSLQGGAIPGLSINSSTGLFSGTPSGAPGTLYAGRAIRVTDAASATAEVPFDLVVRYLRDLTRPSPWADDTGVDGQLGWHVDAVQQGTVGGLGIVWLGYSKADGAAAGQQCISEREALNGEVLDARILESGLHPENDHRNGAAFLVQNGVHAGKLWLHTNTHTSATDVGVYRYSCSRTGRTADAFLVGPVDYGGQHNLGHYQERSDGRLTLLIGNDVDQHWRMTYTDNPEVAPVACRPIYEMVGHPAGGSPQLYVHSVPGLTANDAIDYVFIHPSVPEAPIRRAVRRLLANELVVNGSAVTGDLYATSGGPLATYGSLPAIYTPPTGKSVRVHDVCQFGTYAGGFAVAITEFTTGSDATDITHFVLWCPPASDPNVSGNWTKTQIGLSGEGSPGFWTLSNYGRDIRFIYTATGVRIARWRNAGTFAAPVWECEEWFGATGSALALDRSGMRQVGTGPFGTRIHPVHGNSPLRFFGGRHALYTHFDTTTPASIVAPYMRGAGKAVPFCTRRPTVSGGTATGDVQTCTPGTWIGDPAPTITRQWFRVASDVQPSEFWTRIAGATGLTYTRQAADAGFRVVCREIGSNAEGVSAADSERTAASGTLWTPASISGLVWAMWDGDLLATYDDVASQWDASAGSGAFVWSQGAGGSRGRASIYDGGHHLRFDPTSATAGGQWMDSDAAIRDIYRNKSAIGAMLFVQSRSTSTQNRAMLHHSLGGAAASPRLLLRQNTSAQWQFSCRRADADGSSTQIGTTAVVASQDTIVCGIANYDAAGSASELFLNTSSAATGVPTSGAGTSDTAALSCRLGTSDTAGANWNGRYYGVLMFAKSSGAISTDERQRLEGWMAHRLGKTGLLPGGHPYKSARPLV